MKIYNINNLAKKIDFDSKTSESENKYLTSANYNKLAEAIVDNQIKRTNLVNRSDTADFIKQCWIKWRSSRINNKNWININTSIFSKKDRFW